MCYEVAVYLAPKGEFVCAAALAGGAALWIGLGKSDDEGKSEGIDKGSGLGLSEEVVSRAQEAAKACQGGGTLEAMGQILEACLSTEILKSKYLVCSKGGMTVALLCRQHLK